MTDRGTDLPTEVFQVEHLDGGLCVETAVLKFAFVAPAGIQTAGPSQLTEREQIIGPTLEIVET